MVKYAISFFRVDLEKKEFFIDLAFPLLQVEGEYDVNLVMFNLPIKSTGPVFINSSKYKYIYNFIISFSNCVYSFYSVKFQIKFISQYKTYK